MRDIALFTVDAMSDKLYSIKVKILNEVGATRCIPFAITEMVVRKGGGKSKS